MGEPKSAYKRPTSFIGKDFYTIFSLKLFIWGSQSPPTRDIPVSFEGIFVQHAMDGWMVG